MLTPERARKVWDEAGELQRTGRRFGPNADIVPALLTDGERAAVKALWDTMPGNTTWMDAFHRIRMK